MFKIFVFFFSALFMGLYAQENNQSFHNYFYDQRRSFFETMPAGKNEIILLGDSITNCANWDEIFSSQNVINRGISGDITLGVLDRMDEIIRRKPKKIFILIGINDIAQKINPEIILKNYKGIVLRLKSDSPRTKIYIQSILPTNDEFDTFKNHQGKMPIIKEVNIELEKLAKENNVMFINLFPHFLDENGKLSKSYTNDGLHLLGPGYLLWASILKKYIE
ncbi:GDSL-type esterase/lipase family protein [Flavobacterium quisquiliarum]|uniref:GDSL-type esterase/lipase family protein n=1 Tax=Flavobacterium quisquiliarum TaxID=1834436 RepID=A0ABV8W739_9FLAO|nr:GDSL-type esterase/lipase family protein [Flavobacterium quisquiliarum]MBW1654113.1 sialate O-acetylesterase [Flavobacterium quisquiliarum]